MFIATRLALSLALVAPSSAVHGYTVRVKVGAVEHGAEELCLALGPSDSGASWHAEGVPVVARPCGASATSECGGQTNCGLSHLWWHDAHGQVVSHVSGKCLAAGPSGPMQTACGSDVGGGWQIRAEGGLESLSQPGQCLTPSLGESKTDRPWRALDLRPCALELRAWQTESVNLVTYPIVYGWDSFASPWYEVSVADITGSSGVQSSFVYYSQPANGEPLQGQSNSYTTFSFEGLVAVTVKRNSGKFNNVLLRPLSLNLVHEVLDDGATIRFFVPSPGGKISVEFDDDWRTDPLLIFADPLEYDVPAHSSYYYGPGEHYLDNPVMLTSGDKVYIAGGAVLFAGNSDQNMFDTGSDSSLSDIQITGRGIISGKVSTQYPFLVTLCGSNHFVEGIHLVEAPPQSHLQINAPWACDGGWSGYAGGGTVRNVKLLSWNFADGIYAGARSMISDSFTKVNDDGVKPFESGAVCERNVHWQQVNGWAIMIAWLTEGDQSGIRVSDSTILHDGHTLENDFPVASCDPCYPNQASIGAVQGGSGSVSNVLIENIVMETTVLRPVWIGIDKSFWGTTGAGSISNFKLSNIRVLGSNFAKSQVVSPFDAGQVSGIEFHNFEIWGKTATSADEAYAEIIPQGLDVAVTKNLPLPPPTPAGVPNVFQLRHDHSKCLDMGGGVPAAGVYVQLWECNGLAGQSWLWDADAHRMRSAGDPTLCLDIPNGDLSSKFLWLQKCTDAKSAADDIVGSRRRRRRSSPQWSGQVWDYDPVTGGIYHFTTSKLDKGVCLDLNDDVAAMGALIQLYDCLDMAQQSWDMAPLAIVFQVRGDNSKCLDTIGGVPAAGVWLQLWECTESQAQTFFWDQNAHTIRSAFDTSLCLEVPRGDNYATNVWLQKCDGFQRQSWDYDSDSGGIFHFKSKDLKQGAVCLDFKLTEMGQVVQLYDCDKGSGQSWDQGSVVLSSPAQAVFV